jgi:hypothetical protein
MTKAKRKIAVVDFETDPFLSGRHPIPFAWGFYDGERYVSDWTRKAWIKPRGSTGWPSANSLADFLEDLNEDESEELLIYAHNGGKFDFMFLMHRMSGNIKIVNGRIIQCQIGQHTLRDSYAIMPIPLSKLGDKLDIDYQKMERDTREANREEIDIYLKADCVELYKAVVAFHEEFGDQLTIGGTAMKQLKKFHEFDAVSEDFDKVFRPYYFGGRCQCFEAGDITGDFKGYDINASYPDTMKRLKHPVSRRYHTGNKISRHTTAFVTWEGVNRNAVPTRKKDGGLDFTVPRGTFATTIHEFNMGLETGTISPERIIQTVDFDMMISFEEFIDHFHNARLRAKEAEDKFLDLFYKLISNSSYGKFAQSPNSFEDSIILRMGDIPPALYHKATGKILPDSEQWVLRHKNNGYAIWCKPSSQKTYFNIATAASITGGSRAKLLHGIANSTRPVYCDTDSIYCESLNVEMDDKKLGAWKHEFTASRIAIAGKKLYTVLGTLADNPSLIKGATKKLAPGETLDLNSVRCLKKAHKGVILSSEQIIDIANGATVEVANQAPSMKLDGNHVFVKRRIRRTQV